MQYEYRTRFITGTSYEIEVRVDQAIAESVKEKWEPMNVSISSSIGRADFTLSVVAAILFRRARPAPP